jgi:hypothetical protein
MALALPGTTEAPHFDRAAFRTTVRIFATLHEESESGIANLKLSPDDQAQFCTASGGTVFPVPNKWGEQGWTSFPLREVSRGLLGDALAVAHEQASKPAHARPARKPARGKPARGEPPRRPA